MPLTGPIPAGGIVSVLGTVAAPIAAVWTLIQSTRRLQREQWLSAERTSGRFSSTNSRSCPFPDRQVIAHHGLQVFLTVDESRLFGVTTSGSTGTPGRFLRSSLEEAEFSARWRRVLAAYGCGPLDSQVNLATARKPSRRGPVALMIPGRVPNLGG